MSRPTPGQYALLLALLALLSVFLLYPIWLTLSGAFRTRDGDGFTLYHVITVFTDPVLRGGLINALIIAALTTLLSTLIALPLALLGARHDFPGKGVLSALLLLPLVLPPFVGAIGMRYLLGRAGSVNTILIELGLRETPIDFIGAGGLWAVVIVEALHLYPILFLNLVAALANLDPALEEAAASAGAGPWTRFRRIVLPLIRPGLFAGCTIVFIWSFTELGTPLMFEFEQVTPVQIFQGIKEIADSQQPFALTAVMLTSAVVLYAIGRGLFGGRSYAMYAKASVAGRARPLGPVAGAFAALFFMVIIAIAALPHMAVILASLSRDGQWYESVLPRAFTLAHYREALTHPLAAGSIRNSLLYASLAMALDLVLGILIARLLVRSRVRGRGLLDALSMLPLAVPGLVMAFGYVAMTLRWPFGKGDPLEGWLDVVGVDPNPLLLLVIAYAVRRLPYVVRAAVAGLEQTSSELEEAALSVGAGRFTMMRRIVVPLIAANLIAGGLLAFSFAMLEVSDSLILAQREADYPITKAIYTLTERLGDGQAVASALGVWGMALLAVTLIGASLLMGKRMGAIFRV